MEQAPPLTFPLWRLRHPTLDAVVLVLTIDAPAPDRVFGSLTLNGHLLRSPRTGEVVLKGHATMEALVRLGAGLVEDGWLDLDLEE